MKKIKALVFFMLFSSLAPLFSEAYYDSSGIYRSSSTSLNYKDISCGYTGCGNVMENIRRSSGSSKSSYKNYTKSYKNKLQNKVVTFCAPKVFIKKKCQNYCNLVENNNKLCNSKLWPKADAVEAKKGGK